LIEAARRCGVEGIRPSHPRVDEREDRGIDRCVEELRRRPDEAAGDILTRPYRALPEAPHLLQFEDAPPILILDMVDDILGGGIIRHLLLVPGSLAALVLRLVLDSGHATTP